MPIPRGAHYVSGEPNRVMLPGGDVVTRAYARTLGAREHGYKNERAYRGHAAGDEKYYRAWTRTEQGQQALAQVSNTPGKTAADLKRELIAARNSRPHGGRPGGQPYYEFMDEYDLSDTEDWIDY